MGKKKRALLISFTLPFPASPIAIAFYLDCKNCEDLYYFVRFYIIRYCLICLNEPTFISTYSAMYELSNSYTEEDSASEKILTLYNFHLNHFSIIPFN